MTSPRRKPVRLCSVCHLPQRTTQHGPVCANGHGGADSYVAVRVIPRTVHQQARRLAARAVDALMPGQSDVLVRAALSKIADRVLRGRPEEGQCCQWEDRDMNGGCRNCGGPCL